MAQIIVNREYFKSTERFIPHAKDEPTDGILGVKNNLDQMILKYERDYLVSSLGYPLYKLFFAELDDAQGNGLDSGADVKWDQLLNGLEYTIDGTLTNFRGIRFQDGSKYESAIADYIFWNYIRNDVQTYGGLGVQKEIPGNARIETEVRYATNAWRSYYKLTVGQYATVNVYQNQLGIIGVDYFGSHGNTERSLYEFIRDQNKLTPDKYPDWMPMFIENSNPFGI